MNQTWHRRGSIAVGELIISLATLGLAVLVLFQTQAIPVTPIYAKVGPTIFPYMTALGLGAMGVLLLLSAVRGGWQPDEEREHAPRSSGTGLGHGRTGAECAADQ